MKLSRFICLGISLLIIGCSSNTISTSYYLLNSQPPTLSHPIDNKDEIKTKQIILLSVRDLPQYLDQPHLVMQLAEHQLHYANLHMWAEPIKIGFEKSLSSELSKAGLMVYMKSESLNSNQAKLSTLLVEINFFHATVNSSVILSGNYILENSEKKLSLKGRPFYFELQLNEDGYAHSIAQMRKLVNKLATQIVAQEFNRTTE